MGGDLRSELLRGSTASKEEPPNYYGGEYSGGSQTQVQISGWASSNGSTFLEATQQLQPGLGMQSQRAGSGTEATLLRICSDVPLNSSAHGGLDQYSAAARTAATSSVSVDAPGVADAVFKLQSDARSREAAPAAAWEASADAEKKVTILGSVAAGSYPGPTDSGSACHSTNPLDTILYTAVPLLRANVQGKPGVAPPIAVRSFSSGLAPKR